MGVGVGDGAEPSGPSIAAFHQRCLDQITAGEEIGALLEAFFLQVAQSDLPPEDIVQLVLMGMGMAGATVKDPEGRPIEDPEQALGQLQEFWENFARERLPVLRRLGLAPATA